MLIDRQNTKSHSGNKNERTALKTLVTLKLVLFCPFFAVTLFAQETNQETVSTDQNFRLFEDIENNSPSGNQPGSSRVTRENRNSPSSPEFTLVGTSRIGSKYQAILLNRSGESVIINTSPNANTRVPGFSDYTVVNVGAGQVSLRYPGNNPCVDYIEKGVSCNSAANIAALTLTTGEAIASTRSGLYQNQNSDTSNDSNESEATIVNPFEALRASQANNPAANSDAAENNGRFRPRRIDPDDVPAGSRVISTPFGDRIVDQ